MVFNWVNTTGEYVLGSIVKETAQNSRERRGGQADRGEVIGNFYSMYFAATNIIGSCCSLPCVRGWSSASACPWR